MEYNIVVLPGDGIGPEVVREAVKVLKRVEQVYGISVKCQEELIGGAAIDKTGIPLPPATLEASKKADAVLLGAVGGPKWDTLPADIRPERGLLAIRKELNLFANLRPSMIFPELANLSCLKSDIVGKGLDILVVRELTGGIYFGQPAALEIRNGLRTAYNTMIYDESEIRRIAHVAFISARKRNKRVCSIDKANVLEVSRLWRAVVEEVHKEYASDVQLSHMYVDNCAMQLVINPSQFDVILTSNLFGDVLSDESAAIAGSLGMLPSASLGDATGKRVVGLFEPIHGSAPDLAGQDKANPLATILSLAMLLRTSLHQDKAADAVENAVRSTLKDGYRTGDIARSPGVLVGCQKMGDMVAERIA